MSRYIGWVIDIQGASSWYPALLATLNHNFFQPVTLTGISPGTDSKGGRGTDWFLSGCTDNGHVFWNSEKRLSVKVATTPCTSKADYLARMADALLNQAPEIPASPFERFDEDLLVSFLEDRPLERSAFEECLKWTQERKCASLELRGSVNLSDSLSDSNIWNRSFDYAVRARDGTIVNGGPFVECKVSTPDEWQDKAHLRVYTNSTIWLRHPEEVRGADSLGGRATPELADVFLPRLVDLCRIIAASSVDKIIYSALCVGDTFRRYDGERISQAFQSGLRDLAIPYEEVY